MTMYDKFKQECTSEVAIQGADTLLRDASREWMDRANARKYSYHFEWLGRPTISNGLAVRSSSIPRT